MKPSNFYKNRTRLLEEIVKKYNLILNNKSGIITRSNVRKNQSIIDLTFTFTTIGLLNSWTIKKEFSTSSDHELIVFKWLDLDLNQSKFYNQEIIEWNIKKLEQDEKQLKLTYSH